MAKNTLIPSHQRPDTAEVQWSPACKQQPVARIMNDLISTQLLLLQGPHAVHLLHALTLPVLDMVVVKAIALYYTTPR